MFCGTCDKLWKDLHSLKEHLAVMMMIFAEKISEGNEKIFLKNDVKDYGYHLGRIADLPEGNITRLMKANFERLIDGAQQAAEVGLSTIGSFKPELALLISCVGRKLVLGQRIEDEVEGVRDVIGDEPIITGFYSYGEIAPSLGTINCKLHNQTMTITLMAEE